MITVTLLLAAGCEAPDSEGLVATRQAPPVAPTSTVAIAPGTGPGPASRGGSARRGSARGSARPAEGEAGAAEVPAEDTSGAGGEAAPTRVTIEGIGGVPVGARDLAASAQGLSRLSGSGTESSGLGARTGALTRGGTVEAIEVDFPTMAPQPGDPTPGTVPQLAMPAPKPCKAGGTERIAEDGTVVGGGLTSGQVKRGLHAVSAHARGCFPRGTTGVHTARAWMRLGCDGRVASVALEEAGGLSRDVVRCIEHTLGHAGFPAHGLPDGQEVLVPLRFAF